MPGEVIANAQKNANATAMIRKRVYGVAEQVRGVIFKKFSRERNVVRPEDIPKKLVRIMVVDPAPERNWAFGRICRMQVRSARDAVRYQTDFRHDDTGHGDAVRQGWRTGLRRPIPFLVEELNHSIPGRDTDGIRSKAGPWPAYVGMGL
jgi:hypothetical protein